MNFFQDAKLIYNNPKEILPRDIYDATFHALFCDILLYYFWRNPIQRGIGIVFAEFNKTPTKARYVGRIYERRNAYSACRFEQ